MDEPEITTRRAMLEQRRDQLRQEGYAAMIDRTVAESQGVDREAKVPVQIGQHIEMLPFKDYVAGLRKKEGNCYSAAKKLQQLLDELPAAPDTE
jgi:hypothetical protein